MIIRQALTRQARSLLGSSGGIRCFSRSPFASQQYGGEQEPPYGDFYGNQPGYDPQSQPLPPSEPSSDIPQQQPIQLQQEWKQFQQFKSTTGQLGTKTSPHYEPSLLVHDPPTPRDITLSLLLASQAHLGHATSLWNPGNQRYIFGVRQGIHIFSLEIIAAHLRRAAKIVEGVAEKGGLILFVGTRPGQDRAVVKAAKLAGGCHLFERWTPGAITNAAQILGRGKVIEMDMRDRVKVPNLQQINEGSKSMNTTGKTIKPDLVVCLNPLENYILLHECGLYGIPTIGIIDSDADPTWVTYPIPANDDSLRAVHLICGILGRAAEAGRKRRIRVAEREAAEKEAAAAAAAAEKATMDDAKRNREFIEDGGLDFIEEGWGKDNDGESRRRRRSGIDRERNEKK